MNDTSSGDRQTETEPERERERERESKSKETATYTQLWVTVRVYSYVVSYRIPSVWSAKWRTCKFLFRFWRPRVVSLLTEDTLLNNSCFLFSTGNISARVFEGTPACGQVSQAIDFMLHPKLYRNEMSYIYEYTQHRYTWLLFDRASSIR